MIKGPEGDCAQMVIFGNSPHAMSYQGGYLIHKTLLVGSDWEISHPSSILKSWRLLISNKIAKTTRGQKRDFFALKWSHRPFPIVLTIEPVVLLSIVWTCGPISP